VRATSLVNLKTSTIVAGEVELAADRRSRRRGLLGHPGLAQGSALVLAPCVAIHTFFMRFSLDILFVDRSGRVVKMCAGVRPWRIRACAAAHAVIELPEGAIARSGTCVGDVVELCFTAGSSPR
jgi:uncharacterized membrane protein (UPF0127 family)